MCLQLTVPCPPPPPSRGLTPIGQEADKNNTVSMPGLNHDVHSVGFYCPGRMRSRGRPGAARQVCDPISFLLALFLCPVCSCFFFFFPVLLRRICSIHRGMIVRTWPILPQKKTAAVWADAVKRRWHRSHRPRSSDGVKR